MRPLQWLAACGLAHVSITLHFMPSSSLDRDACWLPDRVSDPATPALAHADQHPSHWVLQGVALCLNIDT